MRADFRHRSEIIQIINTKTSSTLNQIVQQVTCCQHIVDRTVTRLMRKTQTCRKRRQLTILYFSADKPASQPNGVKHSIRQLFSPITHERSVDESNIESCIMRNQDRVANKIKQVIKHIFNRGRVSHHRVGNASQQNNKRRNRTLRIHQCRETLDLFAGAILHRTNFGDCFVFV